MKVHDLVILAHDLEALPLRAGDVGAVVHVYPDGDTFEGEFVTDEGETVALVPLSRADIRPMRNKEILHVRALAA